MNKSVLFFGILLGLLAGMALATFGYFMGGGWKDNKVGNLPKSVQERESENVSPLMYESSRESAFEIPPDFPQSMGSSNIDGWVFVGKVVSISSEKLVFNQEMGDDAPVVMREIPLSPDVIVTFQKKKREVGVEAGQEYVVQSGQIVPTTPQNEAIATLADVREGNRVSVSIWRDKGITSISLLD